MERNINTPSLQLLQLFCQHQLGATGFVDVIDLIERVANQVKTEPARFDHVVRPAFHFVRENFLAIIPHAQAHALAHSFHSQRDELIVAQTICVTDDVRARFIHAEDHQHSLFL
jgi:hypothetical protein